MLRVSADAAWDWPGWTPTLLLLLPPPPPPPLLAAAAELDTLGTLDSTAG